MADLLSFNPNRALTANIMAAAGARAFFYDAGTTNLKTVYADVGLTTPHPSPLLANSAGVFAAVYTDGLPTKVVVQSSSGATLYTIDLAEAVDAGVTEFATVAALVADTRLTYSTGAYVVGAGTILSTREEGFRYKVAASGASDHHVITAGGVKLYVIPNAKGEIALEALGVVVEASAGGGADNTAVLANISTVLAGFNGTLTCGPGFVRTNGTFALPRHASLVCNETIFDAAGSTGSFTRAVLTKTGAAPVRIADLSVSTVGAGDGGTVGVLQFAASHGLSAGDTILLYNPNDGSYSAWRPSYREGEFAKVARVLSATSVELDGPLYGSHNHTQTEVYHCADMATGRMEGFTAVAPGPGANGIIIGWELDFCEGVTLYKSASRNSDNASAAIVRSYRCEGDLMDEHQWSQSPGFGTQYGLALSSVQDCRFQGRFTGWRHGIATGSGAGISPPCRGVRVHNFEARNHPSQSSIAAADWHGNTEFSYYVDGVCYNGGLNIAGDHNTCQNIEIVGGPGCVGVFGREISGMTHTYKNIRVTTDRLDNNRGVAFDIGGDSLALREFAKRGGHLSLESFNVRATEQVRQIVTIRNRGYVREHLAAWDASSGAFPAARPDASAVQAGDLFRVSVAGTVGGVSFVVGDYLSALVNSPSTTTYAGNWIKEARNWSVSVRGLHVDQPKAAPDFGGIVTVSTVSGDPPARIEATGMHQSSGQKNSYLSIGAPDVASDVKIRMDSQTFRRALTPSTSVTAVTTGSILFPFRWPKAPQVGLAIVGLPTSGGAGDRIMPYIASLSADAINLGLIRVDAPTGNFTGTAQREITYTVSLAEF
jgi:hypothetical protein